MPTPKHRWEHYRAYALARGLNPETAEDFAQEAYIRFLEAGKEINFWYVYVDFLRSTLGRTDSVKANAVLISTNAVEKAMELHTGNVRSKGGVTIDAVELLAPERSDLGQMIARVFDEAIDRGMSRRKAMTRLGKYFGISFKEIRAIALSLREELK